KRRKEPSRSLSRTPGIVSRIIDYPHSELTQALNVRSVKRRTSGSEYHIAPCCDANVENLRAKTTKPSWPLGAQMPVETSHYSASSVGPVCIDQLKIYVQLTCCLAKIVSHVARLTIAYD